MSGFRCLMSALGCLVLVAAGGCGGGAEPVVAVSGKLTKGGQPYKLERSPKAGPLPPGESGVRVQFKRIGGKENYESYAVVDTTNMTFTMPGYNGNGIPVGEYEVIVTANTGEKPDTKPKAASPGPPGVMMPPAMGGGPPNVGDLGLDGKEIARQKVTIPATGTKDLDIQIK